MKTRRSTARLFFENNGKSTARSVALIALATLSACITVNVNFPETAVQRAADDFVRDLYKDTANKKGIEKAPTSAKPTTFIFDLLVPSAYAQEINMNTPKAKAIRDRMNLRVGKLNAWKGKGFICETEDGDLKIKDMSKSGAEASAVASEVRQENNDRSDLYEEVQSANHITDHKQTKIRKFFATSFRKYSPASGVCD